MVLKGIIFDMDGTLTDNMTAVLQALHETFLCYAGRDYSDEEITAMFGPTEEGVIGPNVPEAHYEAALQMYLRRYEELHPKDCQPLPGVMDLLQYLQRRGIRRAIVTGKGKGTAEISMRLMGFDPYIETLVTGSRARAEKEVGIRAVLNDWGIAPEEAAYVGDTPSDVRASREAGVLSIGALWTDTATLKVSDGADHYFYSVRDFQSWLEQASA